ncbi:bleomycin resistance protein [Actinomadura macra]|uniref:bleomycin resistance protein n=1 Tax=Actinomadura macra TaxID=46164 RepID=UPI000A8DA380|nr:VOC family protein [Actinomadura macra]
MGETTIPIFPCRSIDETWEFYRALGFEQASRQTRPNPYLSIRRGTIELQFYGWKKHDPAASMHMCYIMTTDVDTLYESFRSGLKEALGRVPTRGLPRVSVLKDMSYGVRQFLVTDPDGVQLRIGQPIANGELPIQRNQSPEPSTWQHSWATRRKTTGRPRESSIICSPPTSRSLHQTG